MTFVNLVSGIPEKLSAQITLYDCFNYHVWLLFTLDSRILACHANCPMLYTASDGAKLDGFFRDLNAFIAFWYFLHNISLLFRSSLVTQIIVQVARLLITSC